MPGNNLQQKQEQRYPALPLYLVGVVVVAVAVVFAFCDAMGEEGEVSFYLLLSSDVVLKFSRCKLHRIENSAALLEIRAPLSAQKTRY